MCLADRLSTGLVSWNRYIIELLDRMCCSNTGMDGLLGDYWNGCVIGTFKGVVA